MYQSRRPPKSIEQLQREISYFEQQRQRTKSPDRLHRALTAIATRERELAARGLPRRM